MSMISADNPSGWSLKKLYTGMFLLPNAAPAQCYASSLLAAGSSMASLIMTRKSSETHSAKTLHDSSCKAEEGHKKRIWMTWTSLGSEHMSKVHKQINLSNACKDATLHAVLL